MGRPKLDTSTDRACTRCGAVKPGNDFYMVRSSHDGSSVRRSVCKACEKQRAIERYQNSTDEDKQRSELRQRLRKWGITEAFYEKLLADQGGVCAICGDGCFRALAIDHDHSHCAGSIGCQECIRGLLCCKCNSGIGMLGDDPKRLLAAARYLNK